MTAVQPMTGGTAPTTAPTQVFQMLVRFMLVYGPAYSKILAAPRAAVKGLTQVYSNAVPERPHTAANAAAWDSVIKPDGSGLLAVLFIKASNSTSRIWLMVLAQALQNSVPSIAHPNSCSVLMS